ncbi:hypothetical protein ACFSTE_21310 [Aquimarina hainanensis]|uniref:DUF4429 domain-containing protein n=1 Tax=Aquimarina hainanensis TaxID=1578017 RepID=A0ABW5NEF3_9FLAO|nr:hypothetical protein [Aquimarina sp. TRL1]QKX07251.1 hypothetical protein HN014_20825 [Aquimarina sp. TRL1]
MGFYSKQPVNPKKTTATYLWTGLRTPGVFLVHVEGDAPNYSSGFDLVRDPHFVGGLKVESMGWTGPIGEGTTPYSVNGSFSGEYRSQIVVSGSNGDFSIDVKEIPHDQVDEFMKSNAAKQVEELAAK